MIYSAAEKVEIVFITNYKITTFGASRVYKTLP